MDHIIELFLTICQKEGSPEETTRGAMIIESYIEEHVESVWFFVQSLMAANNSDFFDMGCVRMIKKWFSVYSSVAPVEDQGRLFSELVPILFSDRTAATSVFSIFEDYAVDAAFMGLWMRIIEMSQALFASSKPEEWARGLEILSVFGRVTKAQSKDSLNVEGVMLCLEIGRRFCDLQLLSNEATGAVFRLAVNLICYSLMIKPKTMWIDNGPATETVKWFLSFIIEFFQKMPQVIPVYVADTLTTIGAFTYNFFVTMDFNDPVWEELHEELSRYAMTIAARMIEQDSSVLMRNRISSLISSVVIRSCDYLWKVPDFIPLITRLAEIPEEDKEEDFEENAPQFFFNNYQSDNGPCASLRTNAMNILRTAAQDLTLSDYATLIGTLSVEEPHLMMVSVLAKMIWVRSQECNPASNPAFLALGQYISKVLPNFHHGGIITVSCLFLLAKLVPILKVIAPQVLPHMLQSCSNILARKPGPMLTTVAVLMIKRMYVAGVDIPLSVVSLIVSAIPFAVSGTVFRLLVKMSDNNVELYETLAQMIPDLLMFLRREIDDDSEASCTTCLMVMYSMKLLTRIIMHCGTQGYDEQLLDLIVAGYQRRDLDVTSKLSRIARTVVSKGSALSWNYLQYFLNLWEQGRPKFVYCYVGDVSPIFIYTMVGAREGYQSGNYVTTVYNLLARLGANVDLYKESFYWLSIVLSWTLHLFPGEVDPALALSVLEAKQLRSNFEESYESWVYALAWFDLMASVSLVDRSKITAPILELWLRFASLGMFVAKWEVNLHATALNGIAEAVPEARESISNVLAGMQEQGEALLTKCVFTNFIRPRGKLGKNMIPSPRFG